MVISLDSEISQYEPFGRNVISSVPEHKNRQASNNEHDDLLTLAHHLHNDFTAAELDNTRDFFRSLNDVSISKEGSFNQVGLDYYFRSMMITRMFLFTDRVLEIAKMCQRRRRALCAREYRNLQLQSIKQLCHFNLGQDVHIQRENYRCYLVQLYH